MNKAPWWLKYAKTRYHAKLARLRSSANTATWQLIFARLPDLSTGLFILAFTLALLPWRSFLDATHAGQQFPSGQLAVANYLLRPLFVVLVWTNFYRIYAAIAEHKRLHTDWMFLLMSAAPVFTAVYAALQGGLPITGTVSEALKSISDYAVLGASTWTLLALALLSLYVAGTTTRTFENIGHPWAVELKANSLHALYIACAALTSVAASLVVLNDKIFVPRWFPYLGLFALAVVYLSALYFTIAAVNVPRLIRKEYDAQLNGES